MEKDYDQLRRNHNALVEASQKLEEANRQLMEDVIFWKANCTNLQKALDINKNVMRNSIEDMNKAKSNYAEDLNRLQLKIKELEKGLINDN